MKIAFAALCIGTFISARASAEVLEIDQKVFGMDCLPCSKVVHATISRIPGVASVEVSMRRGGADIQLAPGNSVSVAQVRAAIRRAGYEPKDARLRARGDLVVDHGEPVLEMVGQAPLRLELNPGGGPLPCRPGKDVLVEGIIAAGKDLGPMLVEAGKCPATWSTPDQASSLDGGAQPRTH